MTAGDTGLRPDTGEDNLKWQRPSPRLLKARRIQVAVGTLPVAAIAIGLLASLAGFRRAVAVDPALAFGGP